MPRKLWKYATSKVIYCYVMEENFILFFVASDKLLQTVYKYMTLNAFVQFEAIVKVVLHLQCSFDTSVDCVGYGAMGQSTEHTERVCHVVVWL